MIKNVFCCLFLIISIFPQKDENLDWYAYYFKQKHVGYAKSSYAFKKDSNVYHRKRTKVLKIQQQKETEEVSLVLNKDYTVRSLYLSFQDHDKNSFTIINVGEQITIQTPDKIYTFPQRKFYFQIEDFLKSLLGIKLNQGKYYKSILLSSNQMKLIRVIARYLGRKTIFYQGRNTEVYEFSATNDELNSHWVKAYISLDGKLLSYYIGDLTVVSVTEENALSFLKEPRVVKVPYIQDLDKIDKLYLTGNFSSVPQEYYQKVTSKEVILRNVSLKNEISFKEIQHDTHYLRETKIFPSRNQDVQKYAQIALYGAETPVQITHNISKWLTIQFSSLTSKYGISLRRLFGMNSNSLAIATTTFCRSRGIPARIAHGFVLHSGSFVFSYWCEVFLGKWVPVYNGKIGKARFLKLSENLQSYNFEQFHFEITKIVVNNREISLDKTNSILSSNGRFFEDNLLGIRAIRPDDWAFLPKDIFSNILTLRSLKGTGPAILVKVLTSSKNIQDILENLPQTLAKEKLKVLWSEERKFNNIQGLEGALQSHKFIYRAFIGQINQKVILVLLFVPKAEFKNIEREFFTFISSLSFIENGE